LANRELRFGIGRPNKQALLKSNSSPSQSQKPRHSTQISFVSLLRKQNICNLTVDQQNFVPKPRIPGFNYSLPSDSKAALNTTCHINLQISENFQESQTTGIKLVH
jgi:hypothetical protein